MFGLTPWKKKNGRGALARRREFPLTRLPEEFASLCDRFFGRLPFPWEPEMETESFWALDMEDTDKEVVVRAEAPGFEAEDFDVQVSGTMLTIRAEHKHEGEAQEGANIYKERQLSRFQRSVTLPADAAPDRITARYHSGILEVRLPKSPAAEVKRIEVKT